MVLARTAIAVTIALMAIPISAEPQVANKTKTAAITLTFQGAEASGGDYWVSICTEAEIKARNGGEDSECAFAKSIPAAQDASILIESVPPGTYAITGFHDENGNGRLDFDTYGIPLEATGNTSGARGQYGPPTFEAMRTAIKAGQPVALTVKFYRVDAGL